MFSLPKMYCFKIGVLANESWFRFVAINGHSMSKEL